ncbi:virion structural protein [Vibrio phage BONAISHI]|nr:virion structural protein [Vibrio phage BONAISHI]
MLEISEMKKLFEEITSGIYSNDWKITAEVLSEGKVRQEIPKVEYLITNSDYTAQVASYLTLGVLVGPVFYKTHITPYKDNLQIQLTISPRTSQAGDIETLPKVVKVYDAYPNNNVDVDLDAGFSTSDLTTAESGQLLNVSFQLIEPILNEMRMASVNGVYKYTTVSNLLRGLLSYGLEGNTDTESLKEFNYPGVRGVDIIPATNQKSYDTILIPAVSEQGEMKLTKLTKFIQQEYGVYGTGCGSYFDRGWWFIYPLFELHRFNQVSQKLTIIILDEDEATGLEQTYKRDGDHITILATGKTSNLDNSERVAANMGDAVRLNRASDLNEGGIEISNNKATGIGTQTTRQATIESRKSGLQNVSYAKDVFTDNPYKELSRIAALKGMRLVVNWQRGNPAFLKPSIPVRVLYGKNNQLATKYGVLHGFEDKFMTASGNYADDNFAHYLKLVLFVDKSTEEAEE